MPQPQLPRIVSSLDGEEEATSTPSNKNNNNNIHWIISWDINETILVGDESGGDTIEDCFNKMIAKSAFVRMHNGDTTEPLQYDYDNTSALSPTHWWDGSPIESEGMEPRLVPPPLYTGWEWPEGCCPYYRTSYKRRSKSFVQHHGNVYKPLYEEIERLTARQHDPRSVFRNILPAFFRTVYELVHNRPNRPTFVFRTFGTDLPQIAAAMTAFAQGKHPDYPDFVHPEYELDLSRLYKAKWVPTAVGQDQSKEYFQYQLYSHDDDDAQLIASGDRQVLDLLHDTSSGHCVHGIQDDYFMWKTHNWEPWAGKPVWKTDDSHHHHLLLDDNIHNLPHDGIASVRRPLQPGSNVFESIDGRALHGLHLIRVPTIEPLLNPNWFLQQIDKVQAAALKAREKN